MCIRDRFRLHDDVFRPGEELTVHLPVPKNAMNMRDIETVSYTHLGLREACCGDNRHCIVLFVRRCDDDLAVDLEVIDDSRAVQTLSVSVRLCAIRSFS